MTDRKLWKTGISIRTLSEAEMKKVADAGLDLMEIHGNIDDPANWEKVPEWEKKYGIKIWSFHLPFKWWRERPYADPTSDDPEIWQETLDWMVPIIEGCGKAGIKYMVIHPSREPFAEEDREKYMQIAIDHLKILSDICKKNGCILCVENLPRTCLGRDSDEMLRFMETNPDLRICFDTNHLLRGSHEDFINKVGKYIVTTHISDYDFVDERHWLPMQGQIDWKKLQEMLEAIDFPGPFMYEAWPKGEAWEIVKQNHDALKEL
ncbi:MAG: sugar phosphate isomerase/epimerase [Clostridia bacterium]|nr:sugar phosphate isomerase/epimerase [Clostridia bacterium]